MKRLLITLMALLTMGMASLSAQEREMYVEYQTSYGTMRFYYDNLRSTRTYPTYDLVRITSTNRIFPGWVDDHLVNQCADAWRVVFDDSFADARPTSTSYWFYGMNYLNVLSMDNLNVSEVTEMSYMFYGCSLLTELDLGTWDTSKLSFMDGMFMNCSSLETIYVGDGWSPGGGGNVFTGCTSLVGGEGTTYDSSQTGPNYAHPDYASTGNPRYMTPLSYAVYEATALTFYYDKGMKSHTGSSVKRYSIGNGHQGSTLYGWSEVAENVTRVRFDDSFSDARPTRTNSWFSQMSNLTEVVGTQYLNVSEVTDMTAMFSGCTSLTSLDLSTLNTSKVTTMASMFYGCESLVNLNLSGFSTGNVTNMSNMFSQCNALTHLDVSSFNTSRVMNMRLMFGYCHALESLDLSKFNTARVTDMTAMFDGCQTLTSLDLSSFNTSKVKTMESMFRNCYKLTELNLLGFNSQSLTSTKNMFRDCTRLATIKCYYDWDKSDVASTDMFTNCSSLVGGSGTTYDANNVTLAYARPDNGTANPGYFTFVGSATPQPYAYLPDGENEALSFFYDGLRTLRSMSGTVYEIPTDNNVGWYKDRDKIRNVVFDVSFASVHPTTTRYWFYGLNHLTGVTGAEYLNMSEVVSMDHMFEGCSQLTGLNASRWNTAKVTSMKNTFYGCSALTRLNLSTWNTALVSDMGGLFSLCHGLTELDLSDFATPKVTSMSAMFNGCSTLSTIFIGEGWNTSHVTNSANMFAGCLNLAGNKGTVFSAEHTDAAYAHSDGGTDNPGYLTNKQEILGQPYALLSDDGKTLTFYNDGELEPDSGAPFTLNDTNTLPTWWSQRGNITTVVFDASFASARPTSTYHWFEGMTHLEILMGLENLNTSLVTTMRCMFQDCYSLTSLDLSGFDTRNVTDMTNMFYGCSGLMDIYANTDWNSATLASSADMFTGCTSLVGSSATAYDANHTDATYARVDGGEASPGYFTPAGSRSVYANLLGSTLTFYYDAHGAEREGTSYDLNDGTADPGWKSVASTVTNVVFDPAFFHCHPTSTYHWFAYMTKLTSITGLQYLRTDQVTTMKEMFRDCSNLTSIDVSHFDTQNVTDMSFMFYYCLKLADLDVSHFNTAKVRNLGYMFADCPRLRNLDLSNFNTANVASMSNMFYFCQGLTSLDLSNFNTANVQRMEFMFSSCYFLNNLDISNFNTRKVYSMEGMFANCKRLMNLDVSHFNTSKVTNMGAMFADCSLPTSLDLSHFNTGKVTNMERMFYGSSVLESLNLNSFNTYRVTDMDEMFKDCSALTTIYVSSAWTLNSNPTSYNMFSGCTSLVGEAGTAYDESHVNAAYAHIDGGTDNPGYFTQGKSAYAVYTTNYNTLTFYCDGGESTHTGTTEIVYMPNTGNEVPEWADKTIRTVVFTPSFAKARPTTTAHWFDGMTSISSVTGMEYLNTSQVTDMSYMFRGAGLDVFDLSHLQTGQVTDMSYMFSNSHGVGTLDLTHFDTGNVTSMESMFEGADAGVLDLSSFDVSQVVMIRNMFKDCTDLTAVYAGDWYAQLPATGQMYSYDMFVNCTKLYGDKGTHVDPANASAGIYVHGLYAHLDGGTDNPGYFSDKDALLHGPDYAVLSEDGTTLTFYHDGRRDSRAGTVYSITHGRMDPAWLNDAQVTRVVFDPSFAQARPLRTYEWFFRKGNLTRIEGLEYLNTENVIDMGTMFCGCNMLADLDVSHFSTQRVTDMRDMFNSCRTLTSLDLSSFNTENVTTMRSMFYNCPNLTTLTAGSTWNTGNVTESSDMFTGCNSLVGGAGTTYSSRHTDGTYAREDGGPESATPGYLTLLEPYAVYDAQATTLTFYCDREKSTHTEGTVYALATGITPSWSALRGQVTEVVFDPSFAKARPTTTASWFNYMSQLSTLTGLEYLNTSEVTNMAAMFYYCTSLTTLDVSHFNTHQVKDMYAMFNGCEALTTLTGLDHFDTGEVTDMSDMFNGCQALTVLDLSSFSTAKVTGMSMMFSGCENLTTIYAGDGWTTAGIVLEDWMMGEDDYEMFTGCEALVGGNGTAYSTTYNWSLGYARIDAPGTPGYFTEKPDFQVGDVNLDGQVTIADVTALVNIILGKGTANAPSDVNGDGSVTIADVTALVNRVLGK